MSPIAAPVTPSMVAKLSKNSSPNASMSPAPVNNSTFVFLSFKGEFLVVSALFYIFFSFFVKEVKHKAGAKFG
jgi:hypothetical protein